MSELEDIANQALSMAKPTEQVEIYLSRSKDTEVVVYGGEIESLSAADSGGFGIRVISDSRQGFAFCGSLDPSLLSVTLNDARDNASFASPDDNVGLVEPDGVIPPKLNLWRKELEQVTTTQKVDLALDLEAQILQGDRIKAVESSSWGDSFLEATIATTTGIFGSSKRSVCYLAASAMAGDDDETQTGYGYSVGRCLEDLDPSKAAKDAIDRAAGLLGAKKAKTTKTTVVFDPRITATFLSIISSALDGEAIHKGRSLFTRRIGEAVANPSFNLIDDPTDEEAYGASSHDSEGLATRINTMIQEGVLTQPLYNSYAARLVGVNSTASAIRGGFKGLPGVGARAIQLMPGISSKEQIINQVQDGMLVTNVLGVHSGVNPISGDFSVGAEGYVIRNGKIEEPFREMTVASTLQRMLLDVVAIGNDVERLPGAAVGVTLAIDGLSVSGT